LANKDGLRIGKGSMHNSRRRRTGWTATMRWQRNEQAGSDGLFGWIARSLLRNVTRSFESWPLIVRGSLFRKYVILFSAVVCVALLSSGGMEIWFSYGERKAALIQVQREQARAAAEKINQFIKAIEAQIAWVTQLSWGDADIEERRFDGLRLIREVPAISDLIQLDAGGRERLHLSRLSMDVINSQADRSRTPEFSEAATRKVYYGPVYFREDSEPYMRIALSGPRRDAGVTIAEVNLKLIWDVVSQIKVGRSGVAYVVDATGRLIAHPDISLVLRHTELAQMRRESPANLNRLEAGETTDARGRGLLSASAPVDPFGWTVIADLPSDEAYLPIWASIFRTEVLLLAGLLLAIVIACVLARRMVLPITAIRDGAERVGRGDLTPQISIKTGDELEALGDQFNRMAAQLQESYANLDRKVQERTRQLEAANVSKSRFISAASHDLRQPLHALGLFFAQLRPQLRGDQRRLLDRIDNAIGEMNVLFNALLDISKLDAGVLVPAQSDFAVGALLAKMELTFAALAREKGLSLHVVDCRLWIRSDAVMLTRILLNLVSNAVRYTERGGVLIGCRRRGDSLRIEVCDTGPGIPDDQRERVFDEFYQLQGARQSADRGLGLGLAIVDRLRRLLDHRIELTSRVGKGSRFSITVPIAAAPSANLVNGARSAPDLVSPDSDPTNKVVVVLDDARPVLEGTGELLRNWGFRVVLDQAGDGAFEQLRDRGQFPDLIISDYHLSGGKTGIEAIEQLRRSFGAPIPACLISGDTSPERLRETRAQGYFLLHKPVNAVRLRAIVNELVGAGDQNTSLSVVG
jgi:signal transduction histidine kinase/CheY-like chemotaxis protein